MNLTDLLSNRSSFRSNNNKDIPGVVVSTKNDLTSLTEVGSDEGRDWAQKNGMPFFECSCNDYESVEGAFKWLAHRG